VEPKNLEIEWRHLEKEGKTCERCADTGRELRIALERLVEDLEPQGWRVSLKETLLSDAQLQESNSIYLNGLPIEALLPQTSKSENCCASCGDLLGFPVLCRTLERNGQTFEAIPAAMIVEAARRLIETRTKERSVPMEIKVLGPGCPRCQQTEKVVREAVAEAGVAASVEKVTDVMKIASYGVFTTPAVVVDGEVKSVGKVPSKDEIKSWIQK